MTQEHPITPPPELVKQWEGTAYGAAPIPYTHHIARCAARWGADQELEACCADLRMVLGPDQADWLRSVRRPKPPSLKEQSIALIDKIQGNKEMWQTDDLDVVRRALESLPE